MTSLRARPTEAPVDETTRAYWLALERLEALQGPDGAFAGEVVWNPMLVCQYVIVCYVVGHEIPGPRRARIRRSLELQEHPAGGWGMLPVTQTDRGPQTHDAPWLFHTTLAYVALRLLGEPASDPLCARALRVIEHNRGVYALPTWGRVWLAVLGLYPWSGVQPILPELWLLPDAAPMHPRRLYCHMRLIYLGLSYLYGARYSAPRAPLLDALRQELYPHGYDRARFEAHAETIAASDLYEAPKPALRVALRALRRAERVVPRRLRQRALAKAMAHIRFEFRSTDFVCLSPVNGFLFCLAVHADDPEHPDLAKVLSGMEYWVWEDAALGMRIAGARSGTWDTSFVLQALAEGPSTRTGTELAQLACSWLVSAQMQADVLDGARHYRDSARGGWGFADEHHPWPVSDCTAEALEALMRCKKAKLCDPGGTLQLGPQLAAIEFILLRQNDDGGFGSYEPRRGSLALRDYNPAEIYGNCMLEYSYTECTGSCVRALADVERELGNAMPPAMKRRVRAAVEAGKRFLLAQQGEQGGWLGFWGVNVTYGTFFATAGLLAAGLPLSHPSFARASRWLVEHQRPDGGWGECHRGMLDGSEAPLAPGKPSSVVQTAWAILTLLDIASYERDAIARGIGYLRARQGEDGGWEPEAPTGCFFNTSVLEYDLYRQVFPTWALARYLSRRV